MFTINITENNYNQSNLYYIQNSLSEILVNARCQVASDNEGVRARLAITCDNNYYQAVRGEIIDKIAEIIVVKYKYDFFKKRLTVGGLSEEEKEILLCSLIAADLIEDKKYATQRISDCTDLSIDGIYNFLLKPLKNKWADILEYMPPCFTPAQLVDFVTYLIENKKKRVYIDQGKVYDGHFRRLKRTALIEFDKVKVVREVLLSNCGEVEITGKIPKEDEKYLKDFYKDKIFFSQRYYS